MSEPATAEKRVVRPVTPTSRSLAPTVVPKPTKKEEPPKGGDGNDRPAPEANDGGPANVAPPVPAVAAETDSAPPAQVTYNNHVSEGWLPIDSARKDGRRIWVADGKNGMCEAVWRETRTYKMERNHYGKMVGKWIPGGYWSVLNYGGTRVPFKPVFWHE